MLFVKKESQRQGIATKPLETIIKDLDNDSRAKIITVNSSPYAVDIYHRWGFTDTDTEKLVDGKRFTPMKLLM
jgi:predicted GNAT family N-acyltransferase